MNKEIKAIIFDLDGTLINNIKMFKHTAEIINKQFFNNNEKFKKVFNYVYCLFEKQMSLQTAYDKLTYKPNIDELNSAIYQVYPTTAKLVYGAKTYIKTLKKVGIKIGILTNGPQSQIKKIQALNLNKLIDSLIISGNCGIEKPDTRVYELIADKLNVLASECVFIGDNPYTDIVGAKKANMKSVLISNTQKDIGQTWTVKNFQELTKIPELTHY